MKVEFHVLELMDVKMISWKIYVIECFFNIIGFKEQMKIY